MAITVYGSADCPDTTEAREFFASQNAVVEFVDILSSLESLKAFLNIRDQYTEIFRKPVEGGGIGIPAMVCDGMVYLDYREVAFS